MNKLLIVLITTSLFTACGGNGKNASKLANEVCDCYKKANSMDQADPKRTEAQNDCIKKQGESWNKIKDDQKKAEEYNKIIGVCSSELIKKSFGQ